MQLLPLKRSNDGDGATAATEAVNDGDGATAATQAVNDGDGATAATQAVNDGDGATAATEAVNDGDVATCATVVVTTPDGTSGAVVFDDDGRAPVPHHAADTVNSSVYGGGNVVDAPYVVSNVDATMLLDGAQGTAPEDGVYFAYKNLAFASTNVKFL